MAGYYRAGIIDIDNAYSLHNLPRLVSLLVFVRFFNPIQSETKRTPITASVSFCVKSYRLKKTNEHLKSAC